MLTLRSKAPVRFEYTDGTAETAVILSSEDDEATLVRKLQRVVELAGGQSLPRRQPGAALAAAQAEFPPLFDAVAAEAALVQKTGWEALADVEELPEA